MIVVPNIGLYLYTNLMDLYNPEDGSSFSNTKAMGITHYSVKIHPHLKTKVVDAEVRYTLEPKETTKTVIFDTMKLNLKSVKFGETECKF